MPITTPIGVARANWSVPTLVDSAQQAAFSGISCAPDGSLCAFVGGELFPRSNGRGSDSSIVLTNDPGDLERANWATAHITTGVNAAGRLAGIACPSNRLCVAAGIDGRVWTSSDPQDGASSAWTPQNIESGVTGPGPPSAITCPTTSLCVVVDGSGNLVVSTDPADGVTGTATWFARAIDGSGGLDAVACAPDGSFCDAGDSGGRVVTVTHPGDPQNIGWSTANPSTAAITTLACPSSSLCVAGESAGTILVTQDPAGGSSATWSGGDADGAQRLTALSCPATGLCVAVDTAGNAVSSSDPGSGASAHWAIARANPDAATPSGTNSLPAIACPSAGLCVALDRYGSVIMSADPGDLGGAHWAAKVATGSGELTSVACVGTNVCLAGDLAGAIASTRRPQDGAGAEWALQGITSSGQVGAVSCLPDGSSCAATVVSGGVALSTDPADSSSAKWTLEPIAGSQQLRSLSCPSSALCVAGDAVSGELDVSTNWTAPSASWTTLTIDSGHQITGVACPTTTFCVAVDNHGSAFVSHDPTAAASWTSTAIDTLTAANFPAVVACATASVCVVGDAHGETITTTDEGAHWGAPVPVATSGDRQPAIGAVGCVPGGGCDAATGDAVLSTSSPGPAASWTVVGSDDAGVIAGLSCATICVAVDSTGHDLEGPSPGATTTTSSSTSSSSASSSATTSVSHPTTGASSTRTAPSTAGGPPPADSILGTVTDDAGRPVPGAQVSACELRTHGICATTATGSAGGYRLRNLPRGDYDVEVFPLSGSLSPAAAVVRLGPMSSEQDFALHSPSPIPSGVTFNGQSSGFASTDWSTPSALDVPLRLPPGTPGELGITQVGFIAATDTGAGGVPDRVRSRIAVEYHYDAHRTPRLVAIQTSEAAEPAPGSRPFPPLGSWSASLTGRPAAGAPLAGAHVEGLFSPPPAGPWVHGALRFTISQDELTRDSAGPARARTAGSTGATTTPAQAPFSLGELPNTSQPWRAPASLPVPCGGLQRRSDGSVGVTRAPYEFNWNPKTRDLELPNGVDVIFVQRPQDSSPSAVAMTPLGIPFVLYGDLEGPRDPFTAGDSAIGPLGFNPLGGPLTLPEAEYTYHFYPDGKLTEQFLGGPEEPVDVNALPSELDCNLRMSFPAYADPSGTVLTPGDVPVAGARVRLLRRSGGRFSAVRRGSVIMSPGNRRNPDTTTALGTFGWDVLPGEYRVTATRAGCTATGRRGVTTQTPVLTVPPPVVGLRLVLRCPHLRRRATQTRLAARRVPVNEVELTARVSGSHPAGFVRFTRHGRTLGVAPLNRRGIAVLTVSAATTAGLAAHYGGDGRNAPS